MRLASSFRDQSGFVFCEDNQLYRQVNISGAEDYSNLLASGLYDSLVKEELLVAHKEITLSSSTRPPDCYKILAPQKIPFIVYPYELGFSQLKKAALLTLKVQRIALDRGMTLKDATAYNVQFTGTQPIFIDTLSFRKYQEGTPWAAYWQFTRHFLAPLLLMAKVHPSLHRLSSIHLDGIPIETTSALLPFSTKVNFSILMHIHLHAIAQHRIGIKSLRQREQPILKKKNLVAIIENLSNLISSLKLKSTTSVWSNYPDQSTYTPLSFESKLKIVEYMLQKIGRMSLVADLGANVGKISEIASRYAATVVAVDSDFQSVENHYCSLEAKRAENVTPIIADLANPSPGIGWNNGERSNLFQRLENSDVVLALALIHHLAIANNVPLDSIAQLFSTLGKWVIVEFVPREDPQTRSLLLQREDSFENYNELNFQTAFGKYFTTMLTTKIEGSSRTLHLMKRKI